LKFFDVTITAPAKDIVRQLLSASNEPEPVILIRRAGAVGDVTRTPEGGVNWSVDRPPHPYLLSVSERACIARSDERLITVDGVPVFVALVPRESPRHFVISVKDGNLHVDEAA
jgi:hypothetical protein